MSGSYRNSGTFRGAYNHVSVYLNETSISCTYVFPHYHLLTASCVAAKDIRITTSANIFNDFSLESTSKTSIIT